MSFWAKAGQWIAQKAVPWVAENLLGIGDVATNAASVAAQTDIANKNYEQTEKWNQLNYENQLELQKYQRDLQQTIFDREDNSVQRRVEDLKKAGLSPTLAAGTGAGAGSVVSQTAAQRGFTPKDASAMKQIANFELMNNLKLQKQKSYELDLNNAILKNDLDLYNRTGISPYDHSNVANAIRLASGFLDIDFQKYSSILGDYLESNLDKFFGFVGGSSGSENNGGISVEIGSPVQQASLSSGIPFVDLSVGSSLFSTPSNDTLQSVNKSIANMFESSRANRTKNNQKRPFYGAGGSSGSNYKAVYVK